MDDLEVIDEATAAAETMFLGLRLLDGMDAAAASSRVGIDLLEPLRDGNWRSSRRTGCWCGNGDSRLRLAEGAYLVANQVFTRFLVE